MNDDAKKIYVVQCDNRNIDEYDYMKATHELNKKYSELFGYEYRFIKMEVEKIPNIKKGKPNSRLPGWRQLYLLNKIFTLEKFLKETKQGILVFLDMDAWIENPVMLNKLIEKKLKNNINGIFSRDPYGKKCSAKQNSYINSGSFILKINEYTIRMYKNFREWIETSKYVSEMPWEDQGILSKYVFENQSDFLVCNPKIINSPDGKILSHAWHRNDENISKCKIKYSHSEFNLNDIEDYNVRPLMRKNWVFKFCDDLGRFNF